MQRSKYVRFRHLLHKSQPELLEQQRPMSHRTRAARARVAAGARLVTRDKVPSSGRKTCAIPTEKKNWVRTVTAVCTGGLSLFLSSTQHVL